MKRELEFQECDTCVAKCGSPALCGGCIHNRAVIAELQEKLKMPKAKKISKWEQALPIDAELVVKHDVCYVCQVTLSPGAKEHPRWTTVYWYTLPDDAKRIVKRHSINGDTMHFKKLEHAILLCNCLNKHPDQRARVIVRGMNITEILMHGDKVLS